MICTSGTPPITKRVPLLSANIHLRSLATYPFKSPMHLIFSYCRHEAARIYRNCINIEHLRNLFEKGLLIESFFILKFVPLWE
jgi:hypothetical protein